MKVGLKRKIYGRLDESMEEEESDGVHGELFTRFVVVLCLHIKEENEIRGQHACQPKENFCNCTSLQLV